MDDAWMYFAPVFVLALIGMATAPAFNRAKRAREAGTALGIDHGFAFAQKEKRVPTLLELSTLAAAQCPASEPSPKQWQEGYCAGFAAGFKAVLQPAFTA